MLHGGQRVEQVADLPRVADGELGARAATVDLRIVGIGDQDADPAAGERRERVLVGDVVADVQRDDVVAVGPSAASR